MEGTSFGFTHPKVGPFPFSLQFHPSHIYLNEISPLSLQLFPPHIYLNEYTYGVSPAGVAAAGG